MTETTKAAARRATHPLFQRAFAGKGIDIGAGPDPLRADMGFPGIVSVEIFDREHGDANVIDELRPLNAYDFVYASQTLEHMHDPADCLRRWLRLVKPGGHLVFGVPDWERYEGCVWPSRHNPDHKTAWGIGPMNRLSTTGENPAYVNVLEFLSRIGAEVLLVQIADSNYDYTKEFTDLDQTLSCYAEAFIEVIIRKP